MKLSTLLKVEAFARTSFQITTLGVTTLVQSRIRKYQNETTNTLNAKMDVAVADSYVGQKYNGVKISAEDRYENLRARFITPEVTVTPIAMEEV